MTRTPVMTRVAMTAAAGIVLLPGAAHAQQLGAQERVTELAAALDTRYDSNVARVDSQRADERGLVRGDGRVTPSLVLTVIRPLGRNSLSLRAETGYDFYFRNDQLNRERLLFDATGRVAAGPCDVDLSPSFSRRQSELGDLGLLAIPGEDSVRNTQTVQSYRGEVRCGRQYGLRPLVGIERSIGDNSNDIRQISDFRTWRYSAGLAYANPVLGDFSIRYVRDETDYPNRDLLLNQSGFTIDRATLSARRDLGRVLTWNSSVSYIALKPNEGGVRDFDGIGWNIALTAVPAPDLRVTAGLLRETTPSLGTDALYQINRGYSLDGTYALSSRLQVSLRGAIDDREYIGAGATFGPVLTDSVQHSVTGGVSFTPSRRLGFSFDVGYQDRNANGTIYDYDSIFAALRTKITL